MYDPRKDQELVDMIQAQLAVLGDTRLYDEADRTTWRLFLGDRFPDNLDAYEAEQAGYNVVCVNFSISEGYAIGWIAYRPSGEITGKCQPHNHTDRVWTRDKEELWERAKSVLASLFDYEEVLNG